MIKVIENSNNSLVLKYYPFKYWLLWICLIICAVIFNYEVFLLIPLHSTLNCQKGILNTNSCQIAEYSLLNPKLTQKTINNLHKVKIASGSRNRNILLKTEIISNVKNIYFPTPLFFNTSMYSGEKQLKQDIDRLNNFIASWKQNETLTIDKNIFFLFYTFFIFAPISLFISITAIFACPILTYDFDFSNNSLTVKDDTQSPESDRYYLLDKLTIDTINLQKNSILLNTDTEMSYLLDRFQNPQEALKAIDKLKRHIN